MTREEKIEFAQLYFNDDLLHDDFEILEQAHEILRNLPAEIESPLVYRILYALLDKRGIVPNLRYLGIEHFPLLKKALAELFPLTCLSYMSSSHACINSTSFSQARETLTSDTPFNRYSSLEISHIPIIDLFDFIILFGASSPGDENLVSGYSENPNDYKKFLEGIQFLLLEKRYTSVKSFNLLKINSFITSPLIIRHSRMWLDFFIRNKTPHGYRSFFFCLALEILQDEEKWSIAETAGFLEPVLQDPIMKQGLTELLNLFHKAGIETPAFDKILLNE